MQILSKSEAQHLADDMRKIPDEVIQAANQRIVEAYANGSANVTISKPDALTNPCWCALKVCLEQKGYQVTNGSCQRDGQWITVTL